MFEACPKGVVRLEFIVRGLFGEGGRLPDFMVDWVFEWTFCRADAPVIWRLIGLAGGGAGAEGTLARACEE